jgi:hypothetical protein
MKSWRSDIFEQVVFLVINATGVFAVSLLGAHLSPQMTRI